MNKIYLLRRTSVSAVFLYPPQKKYIIHKNDPSLGGSKIIENMHKTNRTTE
jgi:hypothetical protein